ncbi:MAG: TraR/DksA C4-type zinc finger protein [Sphingomonadaceae bacterium]
MPLAARGAARPNRRRRGGRARGPHDRRARPDERRAPVADGRDAGPGDGDGAATAPPRRAPAHRAALVRLDEGEFGWCIACAEEIAEKRLDRDPAAARCIACAR